MKEKNATEYTIENEENAREWETEKVKKMQRLQSKDGKKHHTHTQTVM